MRERHCGAPWSVAVLERRFYDDVDLGPFSPPKGAGWHRRPPPSSRSMTDNPLKEETDMDGRRGKNATHRRSWLIVATSVSVLALVGACGGSSGGASASPSVAGVASTVEVKLQEFAVIPDVASVPAGMVTFAIENTGPDDVHEFVVLRTDLAADALPVDADGAVTEDADGVTLIGEAEEIAVGGTTQLDVDLEPGKYVLICNILQTEPDGSLEAHYKVGMRTPFEVTSP